MLGIPVVAGLRPRGVRCWGSVDRWLGVLLVTRRDSAVGTLTEDVLIMLERFDVSS